MGIQLHCPYNKNVLMYPHVKRSLHCQPRGMLSVCTYVSDQNSAEERSMQAQQTALPAITYCGLTALLCVCNDVDGQNSAEEKDMQAQSCLHAQSVLPFCIVD